MFGLTNGADDGCAAIVLARASLRIERSEPLDTVPAGLMVWSCNSNRHGTSSLVSHVDNICCVKLRLARASLYGATLRS